VVGGGPTGECGEARRVFLKDNELGSAGLLAKRVAERFKFGRMFSRGDCARAILLFLLWREECAAL